MAGHRNGALWGSLVADALSMGPHWIYDIDALRENYGSISGYTYPTVMTYHQGRAPGDFTHLGDQALLLLQSIERRGGFEQEGWASDWRAFIEEYDGYFDAATKQTIRHLRAGDPVETAGSDSTELAGASRLAAVIHRYWDDDEMMMHAARMQTDVTHHTTIIVEAAEYIVRAILAIKSGLRPLAALEAASAHGYAELPAAEWFAKGVDLARMDSTDAIGELGRACDVRFSFPAVAQLTARYEDDLRGALIANVEAGGDSAARGLMLGLILGAYHGTQAIPREWIDGLSAYDTIAAFAGQAPAIAD